MTLASLIPQPRQLLLQSVLRSWSWVSELGHGISWFLELWNESYTGFKLFYISLTLFSLDCATINPSLTGRDEHELQTQVGNLRGVPVPVPLGQPAGHHVAVVNCLHLVHVVALNPKRATLATVKKSWSTSHQKFCRECWEDQKAEAACNSWQLSWTLTSVT